MIGWLQGKIIDRREPGKLVLDVSGVGYDIEVSLPTFFEVEMQKDAISLHIHTLVREDAIILYGFSSIDSRQLFRTLIRVNGVGPKLAMAILSSIQPDEFIACIRDGRSEQLTKLPGIGKKTAERLVVEMKDRLNTAGLSDVVSSQSEVPYKEADEATKALEALGYKPADASKVIKQLDDGQKTCEELIKAALQHFARVK